MSDFKSYLIEALNESGDNVRAAVEKLYNAVPSKYKNRGDIDTSYAEEEMIYFLYDTEKKCVRFSSPEGGLRSGCFKTVEEAIKAFIKQREDWAREDGLNATVGWEGIELLDDNEEDAELGYTDDSDYSNLVTFAQMMAYVVVEEDEEGFDEE